MTFRIITATAALALLTAPAFAEPAIVATDLNLRAGPGPNYVIQASMPAEAQVEVEGCVEGGQWCRVTYDGQTGYAFAPYLIVTEAETMRPVTEITTIETVTYEDNGGDALIGGAAGATIAAAAIGGPIAIAGGVVLGSLLGSVADPEEETVTYVRQNPVEPLFIQGEPLIGATIPEGVTLSTVPDSEFSYANLNGETVIISNENRSIVYIVR